MDISIPVLKARCRNAIKTGDLDLSASRKGSQSFHSIQKPVPLLKGWPGEQLTKAFISLEKKKTYNMKEEKQDGGDWVAMAEASVRRIWANGHHFSTLPAKTFSNFPNLVLLSLENNGLIQLNVGLHEVKSIRKLYLRNNNLSNIPEEFATMKLKELCLDQNHIGTIPKAIVSGLKHLEVLTMQGNPFIEGGLPQEFVTSRKHSFLSLVLETDDDYGVLMKSRPPLSKCHDKIDIMYQFDVQNRTDNSVEDLVNVSDLQKFIKSNCLRDSSALSQKVWSMEQDAYEVIRSRAQRARLRTSNSNKDSS